MHPALAKYIFYYPTVLAKGEFVPLFLKSYERSQERSMRDIQDMQEVLAKNIVKYAINSSRFYKNLYLSLDKDAIDSAVGLGFMNLLPTISKQDLIDSKNDMYTWRRWYSSTKTTGGSTGQPVQVKKNPGALARERAATWRSYAWAGIDIGDPQARFWGVPHSAGGRLKMKVIDFISNRRRVSAFDLSEASLHKHYKMLQDLSPKYLYGYVSAINLLARFMLDNKLPKVRSIAAVITTSEILSDGARREIGLAFKCGVFNEYGCGEVGSIAHECEHGSMHVMADNLLVEVDAEPGKSGELVVTDFYNLATPLIRYRLGDYATIDERRCDCGRSLPILSGIHGRAYDLIRTRSGRVIHPESLIYVFETVQENTGAIAQFQAIQTSLSTLAVKIIPTQRWSSAIGESLRKQLRECIGEDITIEFEIGASISRDISGKMRLVKSLVK